MHVETKIDSAGKHLYATNAYKLKKVLPTVSSEAYRFMSLLLTERLDGPTSRILKVLKVVLHILHTCNYVS